jgi:hypothetical protein
MMKSLFLIIALLSSAIIYGQESDSTFTNEGESEKPKVELSGYVRGSFQGFSKNYDFSNIFAQFALKGKYAGKHTILNAEVWFLGGQQFGSFYNQMHIIEAYAGYVSDKFDFIAGNQIVKWGRTDGFSPTDNISHKDYFFLTSDTDDQIRSNFMARAKYRISPAVDMEFIAIPFYKPSSYRFDLFNMGEYATFGEETIPERKFANATLAGRINFELPGAGFSVSYFRGYDPYHGFDIKSIGINMAAPEPAPEILYTSSSYLKQTIGADFAIPAGSFIFRGEAAWNITKGEEVYICTPASALSYVAAAEKDFGGYLTILQYIGKYTPGFREIHEPVMNNPSDPTRMLIYMQDMVYYQSRMFNRKIFNQQKRSNHALALTIRKTFAYETITAEMTGYYNITSREYLLRPKVSWKASDNLTLSTGGHYMAGPEESIFDYSGPVMNGIFLELKASF